MIQRICLICIALFYLPIHVISQTFIEKETEFLIHKYLSPSSEIGIAVYNLSKNKWVYQHNSNKLSRPASTMKLMTGITALSFDAPAFTTSAWYDGEVRDSILYGDLYITGSMDPEFNNLKMIELATAIENLAIKKISGHIYGDISYKDSLYWGTGWGWDDSPNAYQPYLSPIMFNKGKVSVVAKPLQFGQKAELIISPESNYYTVKNQTVSKNKNIPDFKATRDWLENKNNILVTGNVDRYRVRELSIVDPDLFFLHVLEEKLASKGITTEQGYQIKNLSAQNKPQHIHTITTKLQDVLVPMLKESDNLNAEAMLLRLGSMAKSKHIGSGDGIVFIDSLLLKIGEKPNNYRFEDGSGLSPYNLVSPKLLVNMLKYAYETPSIYKRLLEGLPIAGVDGTLAHRMKKTTAYKKVKAKTGTITAISSLAGYVENSKGEILAFAILNQNILKTVQAHRFQDAFCVLLSR